MLDTVDHFTSIIPVIDSKAISRRELIFGLTLGNKSMNLRNMIIFTIRLCVLRSRNVQVTSMNNARSRLINVVNVQLSRVIWESYNIALQKIMIQKTLSKLSSLGIFSVEWKKEN